MHRLLAAAILGIALLSGAGVTSEASAGPTGGPVVSGQQASPAPVMPVHYDRYYGYRRHYAPPPPRHWQRPHYRNHGYYYNGYYHRWR